MFARHRLLSTRRSALAAGALLCCTVLAPQAASAAVGDPDVTITSPATGAQVQNGVAVTVRGQATDNAGVSRVSMGVRNNSTLQWLHSDGAWGTFAWLSTTLASPNATSSAWTATWTPRSTGSFGVMAQAWDSGNHTDASTPWSQVSVSGTTPPSSTTTTTRPATTTTTTRPATTTTTTRPATTTTTTRPATTTTTTRPATTTTTAPSGCGTQPSTFGTATTTVSVTRGSRSLPTTIYYPTVNGQPACGQHPLIIVGHGGAGDGAAAASLHRYLAVAGYVIAAPTYPAGFDYQLLALDTTAVIDAMLAKGAASAAPLGGHIDAGHIGFIGTSKGAMIGLGMYQTCCLDPRLDAVVSKIGATQGGSYNWAAGPPLLMINGTADTTVPYSQAQATYAAADKPKGLITLAGVGHDLIFPNTTILQEAPLGFFAYYLLGQSNGLQRIQTSVNATSIATYDAQW